MDDPSLTERQARILAAVCRDYIVTGCEVSSAGLIRTHAFRWSSATIREELAALERMGLVHRPHRSSGRLPTRDGLRRYVALLPASGPRPELAAVVDRGLREVGQHLESDLRAMSCVLSEVAGCVAVSFMGTSRGGQIADIEVVPLLAGRALVVMVMEDRSTVMHPVTLERLAGRDDVRAEFQRLQECLRGLCRGRTLEAARAELLRRQSEREAQFDAVLAEALSLGLTLCAGASLDPLWMQVAGQPQLARGLPQIQHLGDVLGLLEDVHRLADVLCQLLPEREESGVRVAVHVGVGGLTQWMDGLTVVGCRVPAFLPGAERRTGAVALLGSDRIDYAAVIPLVEYAARTLAVHGGA